VPKDSSLRQLRRDATLAVAVTRSRFASPVERERPSLQAVAKQRSDGHDSNNLCP
jgi:hypothetical protein